MSTAQTRRSQLPVTTSPDADLIRLCAEYIQRVEDYNASGDTGPDEDLKWSIISDVEDEAWQIQAQTVEGVMAKAKIAMFLARQPDGSENFSASYTADWLEQVVRDLLSLGGGTGT